MKTGSNLTPAGWTRLVVYAVSAAVGIAAVVATALDYTDLAALLGTLAGAGAALTGGTAIVNLPKAPDQGLRVDRILPILGELQRAVINYENKDAEANAESQPMPGESWPMLPVFHGPTTGEG